MNCFANFDFWIDCLDDTYKKSGHCCKVKIAKLHSTAKQLDFYQGAIIFMDHFNLNKMATLLVLKALIEKRFKSNFSKNLWRLTCFADILFSYGLKKFFFNIYGKNRQTDRKKISFFFSFKQRIRYKLKPNIFSQILSWKSKHLTKYVGSLSLMLEAYITKYHKQHSSCNANFLVPLSPLQRFKNLGIEFFSSGPKNKNIKPYHTFQKCRN